MIGICIQVMFVLTAATTATAECGQRRYFWLSKVSLISVNTSPVAALYDVISFWADRSVAPVIVNLPVNVEHEKKTCRRRECESLLCHCDCLLYIPVVLTASIQVLSMLLLSPQRWYSSLSKLEEMQMSIEGDKVCWTSAR